MSEQIINDLAEALRHRRNASPDASYAASLFAGGLNKILQKLGEEATELLLAAKDAGGRGRDAALIHETADLWFHCMVLLIHRNQDPQWVLDELRRRFGTSGHEEKARRRPRRADNSPAENDPASPP